MNKLIAQGLLQELEKAKDSIPNMFWICANVGAVTASCWPEWALRWMRHKESVTRLNFAPLRPSEHQAFPSDREVMQPYYDDLHEFLTGRTENGGT